MATIEEDISEMLHECEARRKDDPYEDEVELQIRAVYHAFSGWSISV